MLHQACLNTGCWDTRVGLRFTGLGLGAETPNRETWRRFLAARPATVRQLGKPQQPGKPRQPSPTRRAWSVLPAPSLSAASVTPTLQLEETPCPPPTPSPPPVSQPLRGAPGVGHRECSVSSPGRQELLSPPLLSTSSRVAFPARH